jgi:glycosidase
MAPGGEPWWRSAVFYEVFVRSFQDSSEDGVGDLRGLTSRLDYLNDGDPRTATDLGIDAIWLMPVFESPSDHGYDVADHDRIARDYGSEADFDAFVRAAHARGIRVVLDLVLNHTSSQHPWFRESSASRGSPRRGWYIWRDENPGWGQPFNPVVPAWFRGGDAWYYAAFGEAMPDLDWRTPAVRVEARRIAERWVARGVDGFRLDGIRYLVEEGPGPGQSSTPESVAAVEELAAAVRSARPDAFLVGEVWASQDEIALYFGKDGRGASAMFDFAVASAVVDGVRAGEPSTLSNALLEGKKLYPAGAVIAPFLTNHDQVRAATKLGGDRVRLGLAASILLTLPGTPFLYYGEEIGLENGPGKDDRWKRTPMRWNGSPRGGFTKGEPWIPFSASRPGIDVATQSADHGSLLSRYRLLVRARKSSAALSRGDLTLLRRAPGVRAISFLRAAGDETVLVVHNLGTVPADTGPLAAPGARAEPVFADAGTSLVREEGGWRAIMPPRTSGAWRLR